MLEIPPPPTLFPIPLALPPPHQYRPSFGRQSSQKVLVMHMLTRRTTDQARQRSGVLHLCAIQRSGSGTDELARAGLPLSCQQPGGHCAEGDILHAELTTGRAARTSAPSRRAVTPLTFVSDLCLSLLAQSCSTVHFRLDCARESVYHERLVRPPDFQRSPTVAPSIDNSCPNLPCQCHIVCLLYNGTFTPADLIKTGEWRSQF